MSDSRKNKDRQLSSTFKRRLHNHNTHIIDEKISLTAKTQRCCAVHRYLLIPQQKTKENSPN